jgi:hypothetical protein
MESSFAIVAPRVHHGNGQLERVLAGEKTLPPKREIGDQLIAATADRRTPSRSSWRGSRSARSPGVPGPSIVRISVASAGPCSGG